MAERLGSVGLILVRVVRLLAALGLIVVVGGAPAASADAGADAGAAEGDDRVDAMVTAMNGGHPYVEAQAVGGDAALWTDRLQQALDAADFPAPLLVAAWVAADDLAPQPRYYDAKDTALAAAGLHDGVYLFAEDGGVSVGAHGLADRLAHRVDDLAREAAVVLGEAGRLAGRTGLEHGTLDVAELWAFLLLVAPDPPTPVALARRLANDPAIFVDHPVAGAAVTDPAGDDLDPLATSALVTVGVIVLGYLLARAALAALPALARRRRTGPGGPPAVQPEVTPHVLTPAEVERAVADLADQVSRADAHPGVLAYDRAQACLDAAESCVDHDAERDRVGVELLCADGRDWLAGRTPERRCYFNPRHRATTQVARDDVAVPCCERCAGLVRAGQAPRSLRVARPGDDVGRPYFETADVWTTTGYGALSDDWAEQVHRDALERRS